MDRGGIAASLQCRKILKWLDSGRQDSLWLLWLDQAFEKIRFEGYSSAHNYLDTHD